MTLLPGYSSNFPVAGLKKKNRKQKKAMTMEINGLAVTNAENCENRSIFFA
jgi:hypothetical protein